MNEAAPAELSTTPARPPRHVIASLLVHDGRLLLLRRSSLVSSDCGRWHCVTGFCEDRVSPLEQAFREIEEETGLSRHALELRRMAAPIVLRGEDGRDWTIYPFLFRTAHTIVKLNWEHDAARWVEAGLMGDLDTVPWLDDVQSQLSYA